ncbi:MAG: hypothetical protein ACRD26_16430 [Vicinamibacterales bacterium]
MSEWRQFRLLARASLGRLMDTAVASRGIDAAQFSIWSFALVATPPFFFAARMMGKYGFMWRRPDVLERAALVDRLFFIVYIMLACALLAALLWDALFPDRQDQEIVGVLPVRPRTVAAARLATAVGVAAVFSAAIAVPSGFFYMLNVAAGFKSVAIVGWAPAVFAAHVIALTTAGVFTFTALLALRGLAVACVGAEAAERAATLLQFVTVVLLVEALIFLPGLLDGLVRELNVAESPGLMLPPLWFMGLYAELGGPPMARVPGFASSALLATAAALLLAAATYIGPADWNARRTLEARLKNRAGRSIEIARRAASPMLRQPAARAVFGFTLASLLRSRRHALTIATCLGVAVAVAAVGLAAAAVRGRPLSIEAPADYLLCLPLVMTFFLVAGLHAAFAVPTDLEANWTFRLATPHSTDACVRARGVVLVMLGVLPVTLVWLLITASWWSWWDAARAAAMHAASGVMLVELTLIPCRSIPFTRAHAPAARTVRGDWVLVAVALHVFAFRLEDLQMVAIGSAPGVALYVLAVGLVVMGARVYRRSRQRRDPTLEFDAPAPEAVASLNLSQAAS